MTKKTYTEIIFSAASCPWGNPYQGTDQKVLFVCSAGILRSATMARMYAPTHNTRCCGSAAYALIPLSDQLLAWADKVVFVNEENYKQACEKYDLDNFPRTSIHVLDIPDEYMHMEPKLQEIIKSQESKWL